MIRMSYEYPLHEVPEGEVSPEAAEYKEKLKALEKQYADFVPEMQALLSGSPAADALFQRINLGRFHDKDAESGGIEGPAARVFYGLWEDRGNAPGAFYAKFGDELIRVRWGGHHAIYMNHRHDYFNVMPEETPKGERQRYVLDLGDIESQSVQKFTDKGVEIEDGEKQREYHEAIGAYYRELNQRRKDQQETDSLAEPACPTIVIPYSEIISLMDRMSEGLRRMLETVQLAAEGAI